MVPSRVAWRVLLLIVIGGSSLAGSPCRRAGAAEAEPRTIPLWPEGAPGALGTEDRDVPTLTAHLAPAD
ncbi:MAG TPA: hypothetical protein VF590_21200, partial [Isosphaeraceae bacterium]